MINLQLMKLLILITSLLYSIPKEEGFTLKFNNEIVQKNTSFSAEDLNSGGVFQLIKSEGLPESEQIQKVIFTLAEGKRPLAEYAFEEDKEFSALEIISENCLVNGNKVGGYKGDHRFIIEFVKKSGDKILYALYINP